MESIDVRSKKLQLKKDCLVPELERFYSVKKNLDILVPIIREQTKLSIRALDWLVTNYSKGGKNRPRVMYEIPAEKYSSCVFSNRNTVPFFLYDHYKNTLSAYRKKMFDPFRRNERVYLHLQTSKIINHDEFIKGNLSENDYLITTIPQLNFFKWAIKYRVIDYAFKHLTDIDRHMCEYSGKKNNKNNTRSITTHNIEIKLLF